MQGQFDEKSFPTESDLELKVGARVMLIRNDPEGRWVNGTLAHVEGFGSKSVIVKIAGRVYEIETAAWEKYRYDYEMDTKKVKREVVGTFKQVPLRLAYAVTIHKAQGLTLDNVFIDFDSGMFAHGQAYVAFSRARTLEGLEISRPLRPRDLVLDREAFAFGALDTIEDTPNYLLAKFRKDEGHSRLGEDFAVACRSAVASACAPSCRRSGRAGSGGPRGTGPGSNQCRTG